MKRPVQTVLGFLNEYVLRWMWMRISWQEPSAEPGPIVPGSLKFHFPVRPSWLFPKKET